MKILFVEPYERTLFSFRKELLDVLLSKYDVVLCSEITNKVLDEYKNKSIAFENISLNLKSINLFGNLKLKHTYGQIIKKHNPDIIISYSIKPNLYCAMYSKHIPMIANVTGLGNIFKRKGLMYTIGVMLYRKTFKNVDCVFFQNDDGLSFFQKHQIPINNFKLIPGSGVNLDRFCRKSVANKKETKINYLFASRAIKEKGFDLLIDAIPHVVRKNTNVHFNFLSAEEDFFANSKAVSVYKKYGEYISVLDRSNEMENLYQKNDFTVLPSFYREGISNVLLESLACETPIITTYDNPGCKEVLIDGVNGVGVKSKNLESLVDALVKSSLMSKKEIEKLGKNGREYVSLKFDRQTVIKEYLETIQELVPQEEIQNEKK